mgnify:CR=1 FL=1
MTDKDILITPELNDIDSGSFDNSTAIIAKGTEAAHSQKQTLEKLSVSSQQYQHWLSERQAKIAKPLYIKSISAESTGKVNPDVVMRDIKTEPGDQFDLQQLNHDLIKLYGRDDFSYVGFSVVPYDANNGPENNDADVIIEAVSKPWGPEYLKFGFGVATDFDSPTRFNLAANYRQTWVNSLGAEWRTEMQLGYDSFITTEFIQPLQTRDGAFVTPYAGLRRNTIEFYQDKLRVGDYEIKQLSIGVDVGVTGKYGELKLGPYFHRVEETPDFGFLNSLAPAETNSQVGVRLIAVYDQFDSLHFPRSGSRASGLIMATDESWGSDQEYTLAQVKLSSAISFGAHTVLGHVEWGDDISDTDDLPTYLAFKLGGPARLSGLNLDQLTGTRYALATLSYYYQYGTLPSQIGRGIYLGMSLETGRMDDPITPNSNELSTSGSVYLGADTVLGSVYLGYGVSSLDQNTLYLVISDTFF